MADLAVALPYTLKNEGGYRYSNYATDTGGETFAGLTIKTVSTYYGYTVSTAQMKALTPDIVEAIYRKLYWSVIQGDKISQQLVATCLFDMSVLMGPPRAVMLAQSVTGQKADGVVGPKTIAALNAVGAVAFVNAFSNLCDGYFKQIVAYNPSQQVNLSNWLARSDRMDHIVLA